MIKGTRVTGIEEAEHGRLRVQTTAASITADMAVLATGEMLVFYPYPEEDNPLGLTNAAFRHVP